jgi:NADPH:quinone reductase-like Zn-dependent oxidoreductase
MRASVIASLFLAASAATLPVVGAPATQMRAIRMHDYGGAEVLRLETVPVPQPGEGQVRIRVHAASINPIDWKIRAGLLKKFYPVRLPYIPGRDVAGTIDAVGPGVPRWKAGDAVIAMVDLVPPGGGAYSEYVVVPAQHVAPKPARLSFAQAAGIPLVALTAWQSLIETADLQRGQKILIHGGAGGVGSMAVQIAHWRGAHVVATASQRNHAYLKSIGADEVIDYRATRFEDIVTDADIVLDTVGGETLQRSPAALKEGGTLVSIVGLLSPAFCSERKIRCPDPESATRPQPREPLVQISRLFDSGDLQVHVDAVFPLEEAGEAQRQSEMGRTRGKIILRVTPAE